MDGEIAVDDPGGDDVKQLLARHLDFAHTHTPPAHVFALPSEALADEAVTFYSYRRADRLLGVGALKELDADHGEVKSMHTAAEARGQGIGGAVLAHIIAEARARGYRRISLETGSMDAFGPARSLYAGAGFVECGPFGAYPASPYSTFMTMELGRAATAASSQS
jgi:putative acetyltransferase